VTSDRPGAPALAWADTAVAAPPATVGTTAPPVWRWFTNRVLALCLVELQKLRHDRTELVTRAIQPVLWLLIFGETFNRVHAIPTGHLPYLDYLAPGVLAQSGMFVAVFYGIMIIWERDAGVLAKLMVTPTPRAALVTGKAFSAAVRAFVQVLVVLVVAALLGVDLTTNPLKLAGAALVVVLGCAFFATLSMTIAGLALTRERLMGIGQAITMPLFFGSNALYPVKVMPEWVRWFSHANPLSYEVDALRGLLVGTSSDLPLDFAVLLVSLAVGVAVASALLKRLVR
jgi:ABC-2 type transport system permease protein